MSLNKTFTLNDGNKIPLIGLGTWLSKPGEVENAVEIAVKAGYRHLGKSDRGASGMIRTKVKLTSASSSSFPLYRLGQDLPEPRRSRSCVEKGDPIGCQA